MASQNLDVGTTANDGTGDELRAAFVKVRKMFAEIYGQTYTGDTQDLSGTTLAIKASQLSTTNTSDSGTDDYVLSYDHASGGFTWVLAGDITGIVAGDGLTGDATSGDASLAVGAGTGITVNADDIQISDNGVDHDQLANRYTARAADITADGGGEEIDWSSGAIFKVTLTADDTLNFSNYKKGQVIDMITNGDFTITLGTASGTPVINQVGSGTYDSTTTNLIQVTCTDDDATPEFFYSVGTYSADTDPS